MADSKPKISLIIPTVGRCETLRSTLQTAVEQDYSHFEIIVSDNSQGDEVKDLLRDSRFSRVTCVTPSDRLSMVDNWEFALSFVESGFVIVVGDDDALVTNSLSYLASAISSSSADVVQWPINTYIWPMLSDMSYVLPAKRLAYENLQVTRIREHLFEGLKLGVCNNWRLPHLYHSAVNMELLNRIRQQTGKYFYSTCPDVYMSYMLPFMAEKPIYIDTPISVVGHSLRSNTAGAVFGKNSNAIDEFIEENRDVESDCNYLRSLPTLQKNVLDVYFKARKYWPDEYRKQEMDMPAAYAFLSAISTRPTVWTMLTKLFQSSEVSAKFFLKYAIFRSAFGVYQLKKVFREKHYKGAFNNIYDYVKSIEKA